MAPNSPNVHLKIARYDSGRSATWNEHVDRAKNGTFLFRRDYMDYHSDRFRDHSVMIFDGENIVACLPASETEKEIRSHAGLTYGGLLVRADARVAEVASYFAMVAEYYRSAGFTSFRYSKIPSFLCSSPSDEDEHCLNFAGASIERHDVFFVVDRKNAATPDSRRLRGAKKAEKAGMELRLSNELRTYWAEVLEPTLKERHEAAPVHSLAEIELLASRFPSNLKLASAWAEGRMQAGALLFLTPCAIHAQYIASTPDGRQNGALDWLFTKLLAEHELKLRYFSFGTSREPKDGLLNRGLAEWKEGFGARAWGARVYRLPLGKPLAFEI